MYVLYMQTLKPEMKDDILRAAKELFLLGGFSGTTMRQVADRVHVSVSNLYKYFVDKDDLFEAVVGDYARRFRNRMDEALDHDEPGEREPGRPEAIVRGLAAAINADYRVFCILMNQSGGGSYAGYGREVADALRGHMLSSTRGLTEYAFLAEALSVNLVSAIAAIALRYGGTDQVEVQLTALFGYHMAGMRAWE